MALQQELLPEGCRMVCVSLFLLPNIFLILFAALSLCCSRALGAFEVLVDLLRVYEHVLCYTSLFSIDPTA